MPVTTPTSYADDLRDPDHFSHVLKHLFTPALEQAGYTVIPPKMLGATLIHAEIIRHLEQADLVLADLSSHNPNVFFELGLRTSLDRPVVLVQDGRSATIPFDLGPINVLSYDESLATWTLGEEIKRLAEHVRNVPVGSTSGNAMWNYFGLTKRGRPAEAGSLEAKVDLLLTEITNQRLAPAVRNAVYIDATSEQVDQFRSAVEAILRPAGLSRFEALQEEPTGIVFVRVSGSVTPQVKKDIEQRAAELGFTAVVLN
jgi:hypothetical protein